MASLVACVIALWLREAAVLWVQTGDVVLIVPPEFIRAWRESRL